MRWMPNASLAKCAGPMHGIPVLLKDNIATADRMTTTAGSLALEGSIPEKDAFLVIQLRAAGAVILGKANLSEWANIRSSHSSSGWSARGGQAKNPYALDRNTSGSSSGSGVAASANLSAVTVGTETDGSITSPSSSNGIVGIKPTVGLVSRTGVIPISHTQDTAGPMTRTVADAAVLLGAMTGLDAADEATAPGKDKALSDYRQVSRRQRFEWSARRHRAQGYDRLSPGDRSTARDRHRRSETAWRDRRRSCRHSEPRDDGRR